MAAALPWIGAATSVYSAVKQDEALNKPLPKPEDFLSPEQKNMQKMLYEKISQGLTSQPQAYPGALTFGQAGNTAPTYRVPVVQQFNNPSTTETPQNTQNPSQWAVDMSNRVRNLPGTIGIFANQLNERLPGGLASRIQNQIPDQLQRLRNMPGTLGFAARIFEQNHPDMFKQPANQLAGAAPNLAIKQQPLAAQPISPNPSPAIAKQPQITGAALSPVMQQPKTPVQTTMQPMPQPVPQASEAPLTSLENMARQNIIGRMQNPSGISPDIEQAMYDRASQRIKQEADLMRRNTMEDYNRRGLLQSGILSGALDRVDKNTLEQLSNVSKDIAIRNSDVSRQEGWNALNALLGFAGTERNIGQGALDRDRSEWLRQQGAGNDALSQAMAFAGLLAPQGQQSYQAALNQQAMQTQAGMQNANQWGQLSGYLLAPYLQNIWGSSPMSTIPK
jgi:hypothetical protein